MLLVLPTFFAIGFCLGYLWPGRQIGEWLVKSRVWIRILVVLQDPPRLIFSLIVAYAAILLALGVIVPGPWVSPGPLLEFASTVVGVIAGQWFTNPARTRDQLAFIAGAGAILFFATLEYDHKLFGNLAKIGGREFSVEFSEKGRSAPINKSGPLFNPGSQNLLESSFSRALVIDATVNALKALPYFIVTDNQYAQLFSGTPSGAEDPLAGMSLRPKNFYFTPV